MPQAVNTAVHGAVTADSQINNDDDSADCSCDGCCDDIVACGYRNAANSKQTSTCEPVLDPDELLLQVIESILRVSSRRRSQVEHRSGRSSESRDISPTT